MWPRKPARGKENFQRTRQSSIFAEASVCPPKVACHFGEGRSEVAWSGRLAPKARAALAVTVGTQWQSALCRLSADRVLDKGVAGIKLRSPEDWNLEPGTLAENIPFLVPKPCPQLPPGDSG